MVASDLQHATIITKKESTWAPGLHNTDPHEDNHGNTKDKITKEWRDE